MLTHFIARSGVPECDPAFCGVFPCREQAVEALCDHYALSKRSKFRKALVQDSYACLNARLHDGDKLALVMECSCGMPHIHSDESHVDWCECSDCRRKVAKETRKQIAALFVNLAFVSALANLGANRGKLD